MFTSAYIFIFLKVLNVYIIHVLPYPYIPYGKWKYRTRQLEHVNRCFHASDTSKFCLCVAHICNNLQKEKNASN